MFIYFIIPRSEKLGPYSNKRLILLTDSFHFKVVYLNVSIISHIFLSQSTITGMFLFYQNWAIHTGTLAVVRSVAIICTIYQCSLSHVPKRIIVYFLDFLASYPLWSLSLRETHSSQFFLSFPTSAEKMEALRLVIFTSPS